MPIGNFEPGTGESTWVAQRDAVADKIAAEEGPLFEAFNETFVSDPEDAPDALLSIRAKLFTIMDGVSVARQDLLAILAPVPGVFTPFRASSEKRTTRKVRSRKL